MEFDQLEKIVSEGSNGTQRLMRQNLDGTWRIKDYNQAMNYSYNASEEWILRNFGPAAEIPSVPNPVLRLWLLRFGVIIVSGAIIFAAYEITSRSKLIGILVIVGLLVVGLVEIARYLIKRFKRS